MTPTKDTDLTKFAPDKDPSTTTDPTVVDSENSGAGDGLADGVEDKNKNGRVDAGETDPNVADSDGDGLRDAERTQRAGVSPALAKARLAM